MQRRKFLKTAAAASLAGALPRLSFAQPNRILCMSPS